MRFGLPDDFEIYVDTHPHPIPSIQATTTPNELIQHVQISQLIPQRAASPIAFQFSQVYDAIEDYATQLIQMKEMEETNRRALLTEKVNLHNKKAEVNIASLVDKTSNNLKVQNEHIQRVIFVEKERIRREEERRRQEEEERRRREEEERKRREEEARKRREEEEKKRKEEEARRKAKEEEEKRKQLELQQKKQQQEELKRKAELQKQKQTESLTDFGRIEKEFWKYKKDIADIKKDIVEKVNSNKELKKNVNAFRRKMNPKFGQLSKSLRQCRKVSNEVVEMVQMTKNIDLAYKWVLNFIAKAIIDQAETEIIVRSASAIPLAKLTYTLLTTFPEFDYFLTARFVKKCPCIIGYTRSIDTEEGRQQMGWKKKDDKWEDSAAYDERVSGICTLWAVMTRLTDYQQLPHYSFEASWHFLARIANTNRQLLMNTHFSLLCSWWEAAAVQFLQKYGRQGAKLMSLISQDLILSVADRKFPSATRFSTFGDDWSETGKLNSIAEMDP
ncbi:uncharacterized protein J8A68_005000 [[Candida] subhashii]|uniref:mRNA export factor GLE1 n=1 Tax=[Candida] subhashii TaxID=561895 RepID=A0A8J5QDQ0_9ASCO|nr:uncharacterized protein J8A68_005000 [[Candida] subhashii]KAG7661422.1 hypothetical protein J8A68_005000 [[Candida] subhashii]